VTDGAPLVLQDNTAARDKLQALLAGFTVDLAAVNQKVINAFGEASF
jgi:hypothetical protein